MKKFIFLALLLAASVLANPFASNVLAACNGAVVGTGTNPIDSTTGLPCTPTDATTFNALIQSVFNVVFGLLIIIASFFLLYAAFLYISSHGETEKVTKAKDTVVYAVVALIVAAFAWGLPRVVISFFK